MIQLAARHFFYSSAILACGAGLPFAVFCAQKGDSAFFPALKSFAASAASVLMARISAAIFLHSAGIFDLSAVFAFFFALAFSKIADILTKTFFSKVFSGTIMAVLTSALAVLSAQSLGEALFVCAAQSASVFVLTALLKFFLARALVSCPNAEAKAQPFLFLFVALVLTVFCAFCGADFGAR